MLAIEYNRAGQRIACPHYDAAVPTSVAITILDDAGATKLTSTAATISTFTATLSGTASAGAMSIAVSGTTGLSVGDPLVLTDSHGRTELAIAKGVDSSANTVALKDRLARAYAVGDTVVGASVYYELDTTTTATWTKDCYYQALFSATAWDAIRPVMFRIVDMASQNPIRYEHVRRWVQNASVLRDGYDDAELADCRHNAWSIIKAILRANERDPAVWRDAPDVAEVGGCLAGAIFLMAHGHIDEAHELAGDPIGSGGLFSWFWSEYKQSPAWFDEDQDRAIDRYEKRRVKSSRLGRGL